MKRKHLVLSYHTDPLDEPGTNLSGGMNIFLRGLLPALRGLETEVWTRGSQPETVRLAPDVTLRRIPCGFTHPWTREKAWECLPAFVENAPRWAPDVISAHYWMSGVAARQLFRDVPMALAYHTLQATKGDVPDGLGRREAESRLAREAARVVFFNSLDERVSRAHLPPFRGTVIRPGFRLPSGQRADFGLPSGVVFLVAARDDPGKNLAAAREAVLETPGAALAVAGQEGESSERIRFLGSLPHSRMPDLYASVDAVLCPSDYETFGLVTLEALAAGLPVAVNPCGGYWGRVLRATGCGLTPAAAELPAAVQQLMDPQCRRRLGERGRALASHFDLERCARRWSQLLTGL